MKTEPALRVGVGRADITPPIGTVLYGYAPGRPAKSVGDRLTATALKLMGNGSEALLISCTICAINEELCRRLRCEASAASGVATENVTVSATHTHSGPNTSVKSGWGEVDTAYIESILIPGVTEAARQAAETMRNVFLGVGETESFVAVNRRELTEDGAVALGQNHWGPVDRRLTVLSFKTAEGKILANLVHYGCHGTASGKNSEITRDWSGVMTDMLEKETGAVTGFWCGFEGDIGPNLPSGRTTGSYSEMLQLGAQAGIDAIRAFRSIRQWQDVPLKTLHGVIRIPFDTLPSRVEAEAKLAELGTMERIYAEKRYSDVNACIHWLNVLEEHSSGRPLKTEWIFDQNITVIGPVSILPCPFEAFSEIGLRLRKHSPYGYTLNLCNTHGCYAYLPSAGEIERGGYEVWHFMLAMRTTYPLPRRTDDAWVKQNLALLREEN